MSVSSLDGSHQADDWLLAGAPLADPLGPDLPSGVHRVRSRSATSTLVPALERAGWATTVVDLAGALDKSTVLEAFARSLAFPAWVGHNWDALDDALRDLSWWPAGRRGRVIVVRGAGRTATTVPRVLETLRDVLVRAGNRWAVTDTPLVVLVRR